MTWRMRRASTSCSAIAPICVDGELARPFDSASASEAVDDLTREGRHVGRLALERQLARFGQRQGAQVVDQSLELARLDRMRSRCSRSAG